MKIIRFIDITESVEDEDGNIYEKEKLSNFMLPTIIDPYRIEYIYPLFTADGRLYKNVSVIKYEQDMLKVLGNPDYLWDLKNNKREPFIGFHGKQTKTYIEDRTQIKSEPQRGTEGSS